jgi:hypothetical protein
MKKAIYLTCSIILLCVSTSMAQLDKLKKNVTDKVESATGSGTGLSQEEVGAGLKEALNKGVEKGVDQLSKPDGFFKDPERSAEC